MNLLLCQRRSPKPGAGGSSPSTPAILKSPWENTQGFFDEHDAEPVIKFRKGRGSRKAPLPFA